VVGLKSVLHWNLMFWFESTVGWDGTDVELFSIYGLGKVYNLFVSLSWKRNLEIGSPKTYITWY
jgi:hypothetical protein